MRAVYIRKGEVSGETGICIVVNGKRLPKAELLVSALSTRFPDIVSIVLNINEERTNVVLGKKFVTLFGKDGISDTLCGVTVDISPAAFYQVNHGAAELLYRKAAKLAALTGEETLLDLYCGAGTIGLSMAAGAKRLIGVEIVPQAVENARRNAERMGVTNAEFICGDAAEASQTLQKRGLLPDVVVLDPPRQDRRLSSFPTADESLMLSLPTRRERAATLPHWRRLPQCAQSALLWFRATRRPWRVISGLWQSLAMFPKRRSRWICFRGRRTWNVPRCWSENK